MWMWLIMPAIRRWSAQVIEQAGRLDVAFLNAGFYGAAEGLGTVDEAFFDRVMAINLKGAFNGIKAVEPVIAQGGAVVVTASAAGVIGHPANPAYSAAKHGIVGLVKSCVDAFAARGARINALCPGGVETPLIGAADVAMMDPAGLAARGLARDGQRAARGRSGAVAGKPGGRLHHGTGAGAGCRPACRHLRLSVHCR
jgi:NAD(P)-dependent dehydrogenase (short-subunit alcohol dehydrogenase family)